MKESIYKKIHKARRHNRIRSRIKGTVARPRLSVFRSLNHIYAHIIDDAAGKTLASASSLKLSKKSGKKTEVAVLVGREIAKKALEKKISQVSFDRGGYAYHGRVKALAEAARAGGLEF